MLFLILIIQSVNAQFEFDYVQDVPESKEVSYSQFITMLESQARDSTKKAVVLSFLNVVFNESKGDSIYLRKNKRFTNENMPGIKDIVTDKALGIRNCTFFPLPLDISGSSFKSIHFLNCEGSFWIRIGNSSFSDLQFMNCKIDEVYAFQNEISGRTMAYGCEFKTYFMSHNQVKITEDLKPYTGIRNSGPLLVQNCEIQSFALDSNHLEYHFEESPLQINNSNFKEFMIKGMSLSSAKLIRTSVSKYFSVSYSHFNDFLLLHDFEFPLWNTNFNWKQLEGRKLAVGPPGYDGPYKGGNPDELSDYFAFNELQALYSTFYTSYKYRGDKISANLCYVEMKDMQTEKFALFKDIPNSGITWVDYGLNRFLKFFCDYGTNPVKAIVISFYVIVLFSFIYFFFYSDWDRIDRKFLISKHHMLLEYFSSEKTLQSFYMERKKEELSSYQEYKDKLLLDHGSAPLLLRIIGNPLYVVSMMKHNAISAFYHRIEMLEGRWNELSAGRRLLVGTFMSFMVFFYLLYLVIIRLFNSLILSLNTFSTLGFGNIPVKGFTRYVAIIEGFIGWFLLSIFSVSLISQILQS